MKIPVRIIHARWAMASIFAALAVACGSEDASSQQVAIDEQVAIPARVHVEPLSLEELTAESTTIVHGKVTEVSVRRMQLVAGEPPVEVLETIVEVSETVKGQPRERLVVRQLQGLAQPAVAGQEILWYLAGESELGLTAPLGIYSGDFRVSTEAGTKVAENRNGNEGLWNSGGSLFASTPIDASSLRLAAIDHGSNAAEAEELVVRAEQPAEATAIPLELLVAASRALLEEKQP